MKRVRIIAQASLVGLVMAGVSAAPAYAWHPQGKIVKTVQNQTTGGAVSDANDVAAGITAKPGDTLLYSVTVSNEGAADSRGWNDMAKTVMTDELPAGVELVSNPSTRKLSEDLGTIKPGQKVTKQYAVKVVSDTDGDVITNKACFTGNSTANDNPQSGCDNAVVKVQVPATPTPTPTPVPTPTPTPTPTVTPPATLPNTGMSAVVAPLAALVAAVAGYLLNALRLKRRVNA